MNKVLLSVASVAVAMGGYAVTPASAQERTVNLMSAPFGTGSYVISNALEQISKKHPSVRIVSQESPGFVFNFRKLATEPELQKNTIIGSGPVVAALAARGERPFDKAYPGRIKALANYNLVAVWLATLDQNIKSVPDLVGKKIALGQTPQINWTVEPRAVINIGYGIPANKLNIQYVGPAGAVRALLDGTVDAGVVGGYLDPEKSQVQLSPQTMEFISSGRRIRHLGWDHEAVKKTAAQGFPIVPFTIPANSFEGQSEPLPVFVDNVAWVVSENFPDQLAYEVTKLIIDNVEAFAEYTAIGKLMTRTALPFGWDQNDIHPGALRAYKEAGILK
jgi:uncharacterized protein